MAKNKEHARNTLMHMTKDELVDYCLMLEHNNHALAQSFEIQCQNMLDMMKFKDNIDERLVEARRLRVEL